MKKEDFDALVQGAREGDLVQYFQRSGYSVERKGREYYVKEFPGLCIKPETNQWYDHYTAKGRTNNAVDCLTLVVGLDFKQAVYELTGQDVTTHQPTDYPKKYAPEFTSPPKIPVANKEKKELIMPEPADNMHRMYAYFTKTRKLPTEVISELVHAKLLYQSTKFGNAVFVHRDADGKAIGAEVQGTNSFKRYKGMATGTGDSVFKFMPFPSGNNSKPAKAFIFESAIDMMSFYSFCKDKSKLTDYSLSEGRCTHHVTPCKDQSHRPQIYDFASIFFVQLFRATYPVFELHECGLRGHFSTCNCITDNKKWLYTAFFAIYSHSWKIAGAGFELS